VRDVVRPFGLGDAKIVVLSNPSGILVQSKDVKAGDADRVTAALANYGGGTKAGVGPATARPPLGGPRRNHPLQALNPPLILIAIYLSVRFEWKMAVAAIVAVIHDIIVTVGVYALTGFEVTPATVVAFLTILGFSLYDTVVVFDKVKENVATIGTVRGDSYS